MYCMLYYTIHCTIYTILYTLYCTLSSVSQYCCIFVVNRRVKNVFLLRQGTRLSGSAHCIKYGFFFFFLYTKIYVKVAWSAVTFPCVWSVIWVVSQVPSNARRENLVNNSGQERPAFTEEVSLTDMADDHPQTLSCRLAANVWLSCLLAANCVNWTEVHWLR